MEIENKKEKQFVHLHLHTYNSLLDGMIKPKELVRKIKELGQPAVAITDHGVMYGAIEFYNECKSAGIKPIIGCEMYIAPDSRFDKSNDKKAYYHLVLLVKNEIGYKNICRLVSRSNTEGFYIKPRIDFELLSEFHDGLICLTACVAGEIPQKIIEGDISGAEAAVLKYKELFEDDLYLEIQNHGLYEEQLVANELIKISEKYNIKLVCTNDCHYLNSSDGEAHEWLLCLQTGKTILEDHMKYDGDYSVKSSEEMRKLFPSLTQAFDNTLEVAEKCTFDFEFAKSPVDYRMPKVFIPEQYGNDYFAYLSDEAYKGLDERYPIAHPEREEAIKKLEYELEVIKNMGFAKYFLDTRKTILWARENDILVGPGRGSGAGSVLNYCLKITDLDPIKYNLLFERFLNPERISMPDIDVDYQYDRKDDVIKFEADSNGYDKFCKIQTLGTMKAKGVIRDVLRVGGYKPALGNRLAKLIPNDPKITLEKAYEMDPEIAKFIDENNLQKEWEIAKKLEGLKKSSSTHACGHIPTPVPCEELFPCRIDEKTGYLVCEYDMAEAEHLGNLKKDLLMLRNLTVISVAHKAIKEHYGIDVPLWTEEVLNDKDALKLFWDGSTNGVFQFESEGMKKFMKELKPDCFEDIIAGVSLYRPGPMEYIPKYIKGKHDPSSVVYDCPELEPLLKATYGVIVYQEQVMAIVQELAGFSMGRADLIRKAMGKKIEKIIEDERQNFVYGNEELGIDGCIKRGIPETVAQKVYDDMSEFAKYAFNKSHAACYAAISMQTAYLKAHYPAEFYAGLLTSVADQTKKLAKYIIECKKSGLAISNPDINHSEVNFTATSEGTVIYGLSAVKSVGKNVEYIISERKANGPFKGLIDIVKRIPSLNRRTLEALINAGAMDCFGYNRNTLLANIERAQSIIKNDIKIKEAQVAGQMSLFEIFESQRPEVKDDFVEITELPKKTILLNEKASTGFYISGHPFEDYQLLLEATKEKNPNFKYLNSTYFAYEEENSETDDYKDMTEVDTGANDIYSSERELLVEENQEVIIAGIVTNYKKIMTKKTGKLMAFFDVEDIYGVIHVICFPNDYEKISSILDDDVMVQIKGSVTLDRDTGAPQVALKELTLIDQVPTRICVNFKSEDDVKSKANILKEIQSKKPGRSTLAIYVNKKNTRKVMSGFSNDAIDDLKQLFGQGQIIVQLVS